MNNYNNKKQHAMHMRRSGRAKLTANRAEQRWEDPRTHGPGTLSPTREKLKYMCIPYCMFLFSTFLAIVRRLNIIYLSPPNPCLSPKTFCVYKTDLSSCKTSLISVLACFVYAMDVLFFFYVVLFSFSKTSFTVCVIQKRTETPQVQSRDCCSLCLHTSLWLIL